MPLHRVDHGVLAPFHIPLQETGEHFFDPLSAVEVDVDLSVVDFEDDEIDQTGHHRFGAFGQQKILQIIIAQRGVFDVNFPHDAHTNFGRAGNRDGIEIGNDSVKVLFHAAEGKPLALLHCVQKGVSQAFIMESAAPRSTS